MGFYVPVWTYAQADADYRAVISEMTEEGWEPFAVSTESHGATILHLRRLTGRTVRVSDDD